MGYYCKSGETSKIGFSLFFSIDPPPLFSCLPFFFDLISLSFPTFLTSSHPHKVALSPSEGLIESEKSKTVWHKRCRTDRGDEESSKWTQREVRANFCFFSRPWTDVCWMDGWMECEVLFCNGRSVGGKLTPGKRRRRERAWWDIVQVYFQVRTVHLKDCCSSLDERDLQKVTPHIRLTHWNCFLEFLLYTLNWAKDLLLLVALSRFCKKLLTFLLLSLPPPPSPQCDANCEYI